jgi:hypothetical protein
MADLSLLKSFVRAAEHGSFSAAARSLGVSAAAVSNDVRAHRLRRAGAAAAGVVQRCRPAVDLLPVAAPAAGKTSAFVGYVVERFRASGFAKLVDGR